MAKRSCQLLMNEIAGSNITTIEDLAATIPDAPLHPVQKAWIENSRQGDLITRDNVVVDEAANLFALRVRI